MKRPVEKYCFLAFAIAVFSTCQGLAQANEIVDTSYVAEAIKNGAIFWDVRSGDAYRAGHISGAVNIDAVTTVLRDPVTENWLPAPQVGQLLGGAGIDLATKEVILYGRAGDPTAYFGLLTGRYFGGKSVKVYHGGIDDWRSAGLPLATEPTSLAPIALKLAPQTDVVLWTDEVLRRVPDAKTGKVQFLDVRTAQEFSGQVISAIRGGHIPGAVNIPVMENWSNPPTPEMMAHRECDVPDGFHLHSLADLETTYTSLDPNKETVVYCQSGVRASETAAVLRHIGFKDVKVFKPGWLGYAGALSAPADDEVFVNIGTLNRQIADLEARIKTLEEKKAVEQSK